ncbi:MAG: DUF3307 domain-containing protein [Alphaproteobacteria bacterium]|nr:DUF3307 domain-containing protein [Alphaproteobacteria bacterium]MBV9904984.1 DUF3307 domain-containing protein [Alphaproteobacteria bacterium]
MSHETALVLWALLALQFKHFVCDFLIQSTYQFRTKGIYGHPGGFIHSGLHIAGTLPALLILGMGPAGIVAILIAEFVVHYHTDWMKAKIDRTYHWGYSDQRYWMLFGADQFVHQLTYLAIVVVALSGLLS